ncbi:AAA family ATPase [Rahnella sp. PD12R]|uniref:AAA family ATPase n=1 Tax=Rahnella sp. PD12R TaxID=2855688 RepID=UPI001C490B8B|nr:ATP-binding protein [Rahnella sp. PD12R]MBV6818582.1 AAA family ATPase [Rahnella sp. PD12R]
MRQPYRLESITLRDVGVFENTHFDFPPIKSAEADAEKAEIHIFTGPNGCGKSTLLYALAAVFEGRMSDELLILKRFRSDNSRVEFSFNNDEGSYHGRLIDQEFIHSDTLEAWVGSNHKEINDYQKKAILPFDKLFTTTKFAVFSYSGQTTLSEKFDNFSYTEIRESPFKNALSFSSTVRPKTISNWIAINRSNAALAMQDGEWEEKNKYDFSLSRITDFIKSICDLEIVFRLVRKPRSISLDINSETVPLNVLPDGMKSIIAWVADLALRLEDIPWEEDCDIFSQPIILFLDEVDIHLHPKWQRRILPAIQKLLPNAQVFVSTHSPFVVGSVEDAWVYRLPDPQRLVCRDPHISEVITPTESAGGKSYQVILEEVFGVEEQFDVETEELLEQLRLARNGYLAGTQDDSELKKTVELLLAKNSEELEGIVQMEMRQVARRKPKGN